MVKRYIKKKLKEFNMYATMYRCKKCKTERFCANFYSHGGGEWDAAVECGNCSAVIAFNKREIPQLRTFVAGKAPEEVKTEEDAHKWSDNLLREFYESMPNCPRCGQKCFRSFRNRGAIYIKDFNCDKCGADLNKNYKTIGISYNKYSIMDAWWYEVVEDENKNATMQVEQQN